MNAIQLFQQVFVRGLIIAAILIPMNGFTQLADIQWGEEIPSKNRIVKIIGSTETGHYALAVNSGKMFIEYYDGPDMVLKSSETIKFPKFGRVTSGLIDVFYLDGELVMFLAADNPFLKTCTFYGYLLDKQGRFKDEGIPVMEFEYEGRGNFGEFGFELSPDRSKILVWHSGKEAKKRLKWQLDMTLLGTDLSIIKQFQEILPLKEPKKTIGIGDTYLENGGGIYLVLEGLANMSNGPKKNTFNLFQFEPSNEFQRKEIGIDLNDQSATSISLAGDPSGNLIGTGYFMEYTEGFLTSRGGIAGTYFVRIDKFTGEVTTKTLAHFETELIAQIIKEKKAAKGRLIPSYFYPRSLIPRSDGGMITMAEMRYISSHYDQQNNTWTYKAHYGPILVTSFGPDGEIEWARSIAKHQSAHIGSGTTRFWGFIYRDFGLKHWQAKAKFPSQYHSFLVGMERDQIYLMYNDNPKNLSISHFKDTKILNYRKGAIPVIVRIDSEGNMTRENFDRARQEVVLRPLISYQVGYGETIIFGNRKRKDKFGRVLFGETAMARE
ncbi:hypothetical protein [Pontibacter sp. G13]|uniref:hypothetical protein n=1 Tax=Pontibacter sp. G13 TaxID=3074898 RepID=UPI00288ACEBB|nr:hypothetical protein [Pontibacter sp. G13]WNJ16993.1 hypothetical protein RJD25_19235 [Pontibacter sp. G13]